MGMIEVKTDVWATNKSPKKMVPYLAFFYLLTKTAPILIYADQ